MKHIDPSNDWPPVWKESYQYDLCEVFGRHESNPGYANAYRARSDVALSLLQSALPAGSRVLVVAAAQGNFTLRMAEMGYRVTWNDLRAELADYVRLKHEFGDVTYAPGNVFELQFDQPFDGVLITEIIEHVAHPDESLPPRPTAAPPAGTVLVTPTLSTY